MRYRILAVLLMVVLFGAYTPIYAVQTEDAAVKEQLTEPLDAGDFDTDNMSPPDAENPEMSGEEPYDTYDEDIGIPDVTGSDRLGEID